MNDVNDDLTHHLEDAEEARVEEARVRVHSRHVLDAMSVLLVSLTVVVLFTLVALTLWNTQRISDLTRQQIQTVQHQNEVQICAQHEIVTAVKKIGLKLGLPVSDIVPPDVTGINCDRP